jgi:hypothetical protein
LNSKLSFRWIVTLAMLCVGILPVLVLSWVLIRQLYDISRANALNELQLLTGDGASRLEQELRIQRSRLELVAQDSDLEFATRSLAFVAQADDLIRDFQRKNPLALEVWYFNSRAEVVAAAPMRVEMLAPPATLEASVRDYFLSEKSAGEKRLYKSCLTRDNEHALCLMQPVVGSLPDAAGLIAVQMRISQLAIVGFSSPSPHTSVRVLSDDGRTLFGPEKTGEREEEFFRFRTPVRLRESAVRDEPSAPQLFLIELSESAEARLHPVNSLVMQMILYFGLVFLCVVGVSLYLAQRLFRPIKAMTRLVREYGHGDFTAKPEVVSFAEFQAFMATLAILGERILVHMRAASEDAARESLLQRTIAESELQTLKNQMKPHFLFNALNNIVTIVGFDPSRGQELLVRLSELYRLILAQTEKTVISVDEELAIVENFLALQAVRFQERLSYTIECRVDRRNVYLPGLVLQTLVENALKHGIEPYREGGRVDVRISPSEAGAPLEYQVEIVNTGQPFRPAPGSGKGLENTRRRLTLIDGLAHGFTIEPTATGTRVHFFFSGKQYDKDAHC